MLGIHFKCWCKRFAKGDCLGGNHIHVRATLHAWKNSLVDALCDIGVLSCENHSSSRTAKGFVSGGSYHIKTVVEWILHHTRRDKSRNVRHVGHSISSHFL